MTADMQAQGREAALDGVRGLAILMVLLWHLFFLVPSSTAAIAWNRIAGTGWLGVDLFFVLSGYLITRILLRHRGREGYYTDFYFRRVFRIFPAYYVVLALIWLALPVVNDPQWPGAVRDQWPYFVTHLQNWGMALNHGAYDWPGIHHFWSLAIEEQFYLLWPLVVASASAPALRRICLLLIAGSVLLKLVLALSGASWPAIYVMTPGRLEGLAGGALIATLTPDLAQRWRPWLDRAGAGGALGLMPLLLGGALMTSRLTLVWAIPAASAAFVWLLFALQFGRLPAPCTRMLQQPALIWLGQYSYGLYLCHYPIYWAVGPALRDRLGFAAGQTAGNDVVLLTGALTLMLSLLFARLLYALVEAPALRLRDRLQSQRLFARQGPCHRDENA